MVLDLAEFQARHGKEALQKLLVKLASSHRMGVRIEKIVEDLKKVSYQIYIRYFLIRALGNLRPRNCSIQKRKTQN